MKNMILVVVFALSGGMLFGQKYLTQTGNIRFFSEAPLENIEAVNNQVSGVLDAGTGQVAFSLLMKAFTFEKALMQEHFNEKYIESDKYPKASFKGQILNWEASALNTTNKDVKVKGQLTIHGVTKDVEASGTIAKMGGDKLHAESVFTIELADYNIQVPAAVRDNIARTIEITVKMDYEKMAQ